MRHAFRAQAAGACQFEHTGNECGQEFNGEGAFLFESPCSPWNISVAWEYLTMHDGAWYDRGGRLLKADCVLPRALLSCRMLKEKTQLNILAETLEEAGFSLVPDSRQGIIGLEALPGFREKLAFHLTIEMDAPDAVEWENLFDHCTLVSGRISKGGAHAAHIFSRRKAVERAQQEKWAAAWKLHDLGICGQTCLPCERWQDIDLP